jgi:hypothetical protein
MKEKEKRTKCYSSDLSKRRKTANGQVLEMSLPNVSLPWEVLQMDPLLQLNRLVKWLRHIAREIGMESLL